MKVTIAHFDGKTIERVYLASSLQEAKQVEEFLDSSPFVFALELEKPPSAVTGTFQLSGVGFYTSQLDAKACRRLLMEHGLKTGIEERTAKTGEVSDVASGSTSARKKRKSTVADRLLRFGYGLLVPMFIAWGVFLSILPDLSIFIRGLIYIALGIFCWVRFVRVWNGARSKADIVFLGFAWIFVGIILRLAFSRSYIGDNDWIARIAMLGAH